MDDIQYLATNVNKQKLYFQLEIHTETNMNFKENEVIENCFLNFL